MKYACVQLCRSAKAGNIRTACIDNFFQGFAAFSKAFSEPAFISNKKRYYYSFCYKVDNGFDVDRENLGGDFHKAIESMKLSRLSVENK